MADSDPVQFDEGSARLIGATVRRVLTPGEINRGGGARGLPMPPNQPFSYSSPADGGSNQSGIGNTYTELTGLTKTINLNGVLDGGSIEAVLHLGGTGFPSGVTFPFQISAVVTLDSTSPAAANTLATFQWAIPADGTTGAAAFAPGRSIVTAKAFSGVIYWREFYTCPSYYTTTGGNFGSYHATGRASSGPLTIPSAGTNVMRVMIKHSHTSGTISVTGAAIVLRYTPPGV